MKQTIKELSAPRKRHFSRTPLPRTWFMGHGYTKIPDGILPRTFYIKVTDEHPEGIVVNEYGKKVCVRKMKQAKGVYSDYYVLHFGHAGKTYDVYMHYLIFCTFHHIPKKGNHIDHINGDHFNNRPENLREVTRAINSRDQGFSVLSRNRGIDPVQFPARVLLRYYEILAEFLETHTRYAYYNLSKDDLLTFLATAASQVSMREFMITDPHELSDRDISRHCEGNP